MCEILQKAKVVKDDFDQNLHDSLFVQELSD